jgi:hypothetical protein
LASPPAIGATTAAAGAFTTLSASSTVSGTGFSAYLASPPAIGGTAAAAGTFTTLSGTTSVTTPIVKSASSLTLQTNGTTTAVTVDTSQNVGIGTTTPTSGYKLNVGSTSAVTTLNGAAITLFTSGSLTSSVGGVLNFRPQLGTTISDIFNLSICAYDHSGDGNADGLSINGSDGVSFSTGGNSRNERMRIDSSGNVLVGYTNSNGAYKLQVNSQIFATSATIATSDGRYKKDIESLDGALELVTQLNPVQFSWKQHPVHAFDTSTPTIGFIAQEVQQVLADKPYLNSVIKANECVIELEEKDADGNVIKEAVIEEFLGIAEGNMIALLTKAIQEQQALITSLTARIAALEAK